MNRAAFIVVAVAACCAWGAEKKPREKSAAQLEAEKLTVQVKSTKDGTDQPVVFYVPAKNDEPAPLLVALHSWSGDLGQASGYLGEVKRRGWVMVAPNFRGPNNKPEACASDLAVQDVLDAIEYAKAHAKVDASRIYVMGGSGGGHMTLVMVARAPQVFAAASAWVPITDLAKWHAQSVIKKQKYASDMEKVCGGPPGPETIEQYRHRSSIFTLPAAKGVPIEISAGIHDGHTGSVPISQTLEAFNVLAEANGLPDRKLTTAEIEEMTATEKVPASLNFAPLDDPERRNKVLFRREAGPARVTIFEGGHAFELGAGADWLSRQRKGQPAVHNPTGPVTRRNRRRRDGSLEVIDELRLNHEGTKTRRKPQRTRSTQ